MVTDRKFLNEMGRGVCRWSQDAHPEQYLKEGDMVRDNGRNALFVKLVLAPVRSKIFAIIDL